MSIFDNLAEQMDVFMVDMAIHRLIGFYADLIITTVDLRMYETKISPTTHPAQYAEMITDTAKEMIIKDHEQYLPHIQKVLTQHYEQEAETLKEMTEAFKPK